MTEIREIPLTEIDLPTNAQRTETDDEAMERLCDSIEVNGLLQPVGVTPLAGGRYRLLWGSRRRAAHEIMGKISILAKIVKAEAQEEDDMIMAENYHREELNPLDEANFIQRYLDHHCVTQAEFARRTKTNPGRVSALLSLLHGDPKVSTALRAGRISRQQGLEINHITDQPGRDQALTFAAHGHFSAAAIKLWADERERQGVSAAVGAIDWETFDRHKQEVKNLAKCVLHQDFVSYNQANWLVLCDNCWNAVKVALADAKAKMEEE